MQLVHLFDMEFRYSEPIDMIISPGGKTAQGFGGGVGTASGDRVRGSVKWSNWPRLREDGVVEPGVHGIIHTDDDARIVFRIGGYSLKNPDGRGRTVIGDTTFLTDHERYLWLNTVFAIQEGEVRFDTGVVIARFYECMAEPLA